MGLNATPLIPYHAVDLPRRHGVVVAQRGNLEARPYEVVWHGASHRGTPAATATAVAPKRERQWFGAEGWRDIDPASYEYQVAYHLHTHGPATVRALADAVKADALPVREALKRLRLKGYAVATGTSDVGTAKTWRLVR